MFLPFDNQSKNFILNSNKMVSTWRWLCSDINLAFFFLRYGKIGDSSEIERTWLLTKSRTIDSATGEEDHLEERSRIRRWELSRLRKLIFQTKLVVSSVIFTGDHFTGLFVAWLFLQTTCFKILTTTTKKMPTMFIENLLKTKLLNLTKIRGNLYIYIYIYICIYIVLWSFFSVYTNSAQYK